jgi:glutamate---cysteine ligase / carboxylate-amine ligase
LNLKFSGSKSFSLGAELELQIVGKDDLSLRSASAQLIGFCDEPELITPELYQSMIEIKTGICPDANEVAVQLHSRLINIREACIDLGLSVVSAGTHPWSHFSDVKVFPNPRYGSVLESRQWIARRLMVQGLHVHVGMPTGDHAIRMSNALAEFSPLLLALCSSSPFLEGRDTGLASVRTTFFDSLPTAGVPEPLRDWRGFESLYQRLRSLGAIESVKDLWWDMRPNPYLGTLEIRLCDATATIREAAAVIALIHLLCLRFQKLWSQGSVPQIIPSWIARENRWRALRNGVRAELISTCGEKLTGLGEVLEEILSETEPSILEHGYGEHVKTLRSIVRHGSSADRQRSVYQSTGGDLGAVTQSLIFELESDRPGWAGAIKINKRESNQKKGRNECA